MALLNERDEATRKAWGNALCKNQLLYPDERVVSFLARRFPDIEKNSKRHAIDIGCGSGRHVKLMLDYGFNSWGIDYTDRSTALVQSEFSGHPLFRGAILGDFRDYVFPQSFHAVIAWGVLFLTPPSEMVKNLRAMARLLTEDGALFVNFRTRENFHFGMGREIEPGCFILDARANVYQGMCYTFTDLPEVEKIVMEAGGLEISNVEKTTFCKNQMRELHSWLQVELRPQAAGT